MFFFIIIALAKTSLNVKECNAVLSVPLYFKPSDIEFLK